MWHNPFVLITFLITLITGTQLINNSDSLPIFFFTQVVCSWGFTFYAWDGNCFEVGK